MAKKAAKKTPATAKTPKKSIAPSRDNSSEAIDATEQGEASRDDAGSESGDRATPPAETQGEWEMLGEHQPTPSRSLAPSPGKAMKSSHPADTRQEAGSEADTTEQNVGTPPSGPHTEGENQGDNRFSSGDAEPPAAASQPGLPLACVRDGESKREAWERIRKEGRAAGLSRRDAYDRATRETDRLFPPAEPVVEEDPPAEPEPEPVAPPPEPADEPAEPAAIAVAPAPPKDDQGVSGLSDLPPSWPELPANAQLQVEIAWVSANRLRVRDGTGVNLSKALSPAPSYSALSWLETSILFPAKFADISVKATASSDDEKEHIRREKISIEEMRSILAEMLDAKAESNG